MSIPKDQVVYLIMHEVGEYEEVETVPVGIVTDEKLAREYCDNVNGVSAWPVELFVDDPDFINMLKGHLSKWYVSIYWYRETPAKNAIYINEQAGFRIEKLSIVHSPEKGSYDQDGVHFGNAYMYVFASSKEAALKKAYELYTVDFAMGRGAKDAIDLFKEYISGERDIH